VLALVVKLADLHPAVPGPVRCGPVETRLVVEEVAGVDEGVVAELAARLGISFHSAGALVVEAVELRDRLPRLWTLVQAGDLQAWKARMVARSTLPLSPAAAEFVDHHVAVVARRNPLPDLRRVVLVALNRCDPEIAEGQEEAALHERGVEFRYGASTDSSATAELHATLDALDALDLDATVSDLATTMGRLGDRSPLGTRRAHALGLLANPQRALDLFGEPVQALTGLNADADADADAMAVGSGWQQAAHDATPGHGRRWNSQVGHVYLHLDAADLRALLLDERLLAGGVDLERLGAASLTLVREWLGRVEKVSLRPVLDLSRDDPVDRHDPPERMREAVVLRDGCCVFPGCGVDSRACDLDHIRSYVPMDEGGPPGQTSAAALACLCRRHHRLKTHHGWRYQRARDGTYQWTDPRGVAYTTAPVPKHLVQRAA
jgi:hypothetical protein